jgi:L-ascorbate metabolism protein UlaG (beta-lactamase superfamily)
MQAFSLRSIISATSSHAIRMTVARRLAGLVAPMILFAVAAFSFLGCRSPHSASFAYDDGQASRPAPKVTIRWHGHACFEITSSLGFTVITDPYNPRYFSFRAPRDLRADLLLISHEDESANHVNLLKNSPPVLRSSLAIGTARFGGILFRGSALSETAEDALPHVGFAWTMDHIRFCHLGSPRQAPDRIRLQKLGTCDILFLPVGPEDGFSNENAQMAIQVLRPKLVFPMAYHTKHALARRGGSLDTFLEDHPEAIFLDGNEIHVTKEQLPSDTTAMVFPIPE